jgi:Family of unknown function (DUF6328)
VAHDDSGAKHDRQLIELLNEIRIAMPGAQVLFAFLLAVPFSQRFGELSTTTTRVYFGTILLTATSAALLMAPSAHHRMLFGKHSKERLILVSNRLAIAGMATLAVAMGTTVYVVGDLLYTSGLAILVGSALTVSMSLLWFVAPLLYKADTPPAGSEPQPDPDVIR